MEPVTPPPVPMPRCPLCGAQCDQLTKFVTRTSNRNSNSGRPYLKCMPCEKFITFLDDRGIDSRAPKCACDLPSRLQVSGKYGKSTPRGLHYVCSVGHCEYYEVKKNDYGRQQTIDNEDLVSLFATLKVI